MSGYTLAAILVSVACTLSLRALPFLIFTKNRPMPEWLRRLGQGAGFTHLLQTSRRPGAYRHTAGAWRGGGGGEL